MDPILLIETRGANQDLGTSGLMASQSSPTKESSPMPNRQNTLLWMKDLLEHMNQCHEQLQWASDGRTESFLAQRLMVDLAECRRLCEHLNQTGSASGRQMQPA